jgi:3-phosphoshikimate 1-carboxyvinyltransferase
MTMVTIHPSIPKGKISIPPSKSHTLRAILFAFMADGESTIDNYLDSPDTDAMLKAVELMGAIVKKTPDSIIIQGVSGRPQQATDLIDAGNSGQVLRFIGAIAGLIPGYTVITGDRSIKEKRPARPLLDALQQLGADAQSLAKTGNAPLLIKGPISPGNIVMCGKDSQPVSGMLIACSFLKGRSVINVTNPGEKPWIDLTLSWLDRMGLQYQATDYKKYIVYGNGFCKNFYYKVPGDFSSAAFPIAAAIIHSSNLSIENLDRNDVQGDKKLISILQTLGANIFWESDTILKITTGSILKEAKIDLNDCIDALPIISVLGCFAEGPIEIYNAQIARSKESDRINAISTELKKMGAHIIEKEDGLIVFPSKLKAHNLHSHYDHRIAMSLSIAATKAEGITCIQDAECINKTYRTFAKDFQKIGCEISIL